MLTVFVLTGLSVYSYWPSVPLPAGIQADKVLVLKGERQLQLLRKGEILKNYRVALGENPNGPKERQGDARTPEGLYRIIWRNKYSRFHLSLHISYPGTKDRQKARKMGWLSGGDIMIHGIANGFGWIRRAHGLIDWTNGCIAVSDEEIEEIWRDVSNGTPIEIRP